MPQLAFSLCEMSQSFLHEAESSETILPYPSMMPIGGPFPFVSKAVGLIRSGCIRIMSARWMVSQPAGYVLQRCQDLDAEAFLQPFIASTLFNRRFSMVVLSYPWLSKQHPDPTGFFFDIVRQYLLKHLHQFGSIFGDIGVFWDFAAFPQAEPNGVRTSNSEEALALKNGMAGINFLYGAPQTVVVQLTALPESQDPSTTRRYEERGWCIFEATVSNILKPSLRLLDLGQPSARRKLADPASDWWDVQRAASSGSGRAPVLLPGDMKLVLERAAFTKGGVDRDLVTEQYREFFEQAALTTCVQFVNFAEEEATGWDDATIKQACKALPAFTKAKQLYVQRQPFSDDGLMALVEQLPQLPCLEELSLHGCIGFDGTGFKALAQRPLAAFTQLKLTGTSITDAGLSSVAVQFSAMKHLRKLHLRRCRGIGTPGFGALAAHMPPQLEELHLGRTMIVDAGLALLLAALPDLIRKLDLHSCEGITAAGLAGLTGRLPALAGLKALANVETLCPRGHRMEPIQRGSASLRHFCLCNECHEWVRGVCYCCESCLYDACVLCSTGALLAPQHLEGTEEGQALGEACRSEGSEPVQLRWC